MTMHPQDEIKFLHKHVWVLDIENNKLRAALYDCLETTAKHHAEDQARLQIGGSDMTRRKAKAILTRSSLLFGKIRTIVNAALERSHD